MIATGDNDSVVVHLHIEIELIQLSLFKTLFKGNLMKLTNAPNPLEFSQLITGDKISL